MNYVDFLKKQLDYEISFTKLYRDYSAYYESLKNSKNESDLNILIGDFREEIVSTHQDYLWELYNFIKDNHGEKEANFIKQYNTKEFFFNEIKNMLKISNNQLALILDESLDSLHKYFNLTSVNKKNQAKIYDLYKYLTALQQINTKYKLIDILLRSYIVENFNFDDEPNINRSVLTYIFATWTDKTYREIAYESLDNYKKDDFDGNKKLINKLGELNEK